jgi:two-component system, chemotaxis family, sensor kinase CheA
MAASMGYEQMAQLAHHLEDLMDGFRKAGAVPAASVDRLLAGIDLLEGLLEDIAAEKPEREVNTFLAAGAALAGADPCLSSSLSTPAPVAPSEAAPQQCQGICCR